MDKNIIVRKVEEEVKINKLNYSYSINLYRSFPNLLDGLKVVNRRILYAATKVGLQSNKPHKKSVTLVSGSMIYHNHGDASIYDAITKMTQSFYNTVPYLDGQGSWGTPSGDSAASMRYCITGDSLVVTDSGLKQIKDICKSYLNTTSDVSFYVPSVYNQTNHVSKFFNCGVHEVKTITTDLGFEITGTGNHPLKVLSFKDDKLSMEWKLMEDITTDDYIVFNGGRYINDKDLVSITEARFLGVMAANGYTLLTEDGKRRVGFKNSNMEFINHVISLIKELYPNVKVEIKNNKKYKDVYFYSKEILNDIQEKYNLNFNNKCVPNVILNSSKQIQREFLKYLFETRSSVCISEAGRVSLSSDSKKLITQIQQILLNTFNILSSKLFSDQYTLDIITKTDISKFKDEIGYVYDTKNSRLEELYTLKSSKVSKFAHSIKGLYIKNMSVHIKSNRINKNGLTAHAVRSISTKEKLIENYEVLKSNLSEEDFKIIQDIIDNDFYFLKVRNISEKFEDIVYSIRVDSDCHSFIANGMINHNTETRLSKYGEETLKDLNKNTVNWVESALGDDKEPITLPVRYPNLLVNGAYGIGQGYNSFIPPHNFNEIMDITIDLIKDPTIDQEDIIKRITPDFPLGGVIINGEELKEVYRKGFGVCKVRGEVVKDEKNNSLIIKSFPHIRTNLNSIKDVIADKVKDGYLQGISDIKDLTKKNEINLIIKAKRGYSLDKLEQELYKLTPLQSTLSLSFMCTEDDKSFRHYTIKEIFIKWIDYRKLTIRRALNFDMAAIHKRLHIIEALLKALIDIDRVISIIKKSADKQESIENLMKDKTFDFNILQARYIVDLPLSQLSRIGKESLQKEQVELEAKLEELVELFTDDKKLSNMIIKELKEGKKKYGRERLTKVTNIDSEGEEIEDKEYTIFLTESGFIKKLDLELNTQASGTKGRKCGKLRKNDYINVAINAHNEDTLMFFTNKGNCYGLKVHEVDEVGLATLGLTVNSLLTFKEDEHVVTMINITKDDLEDTDKYLLFTTKNGLIKKTRLSQYAKVSKNSLIAIKLNEGDLVQDILVTTNNDEVLLATNTGKYSRYSVSEVNESLRMTMGVNAIAGLSVNENIVSSTILSNKDYVLVMDKQGLAKRINMDDVVSINRTHKARLLTKTDTQVVKVCEVNSEDEISIITKEKMLKVSASSIKEAIRTTKGKPSMKLDGDDEVLDLIVE